MLLEVLTPEKSLLGEEVMSVHLPGSAGSFAVLKNHAPLISMLSEGRISWKKENGEQGVLEIKGGFVEVKNNRVSVCIEPVLQTMYGE